MEEAKSNDLSLDSTGLAEVSALSDAEVVQGQEGARPYAAIPNESDTSFPWIVLRRDNGRVSPGVKDTGLNVLHPDTGVLSIPVTAYECRESTAKPQSAFSRTVGRLGQSIHAWFHDADIGDRTTYDQKLRFDVGSSTLAGPNLQLSLDGAVPNKNAELVMADSSAVTEEALEQEYPGWQHRNLGNGVWLVMPSA